MTRFLLSVVLVAACATSASAQFSNAEIMMERAGIALSGGNPVPGASSTLGLRLRALPRLSADIRLTGARLVITDENTVDPSDDLSSIAHSLNIDASVGIFGGFSLLPTVGGFGSIDLLGSYGKLSLSDDDGFRDDPMSWGAGVRIGILRESFTAPGLSVSAMYRNIGDYAHVVGEPEVDAGTITRLENNQVLSLRATVGKRLLMLGATAGVGYDKYRADGMFIPAETIPPTPAMLDELETSATTIFGNLSWTMLLLHIVGEGGVQRASGESAIYGSLVVRLSL